MQRFVMLSAPYVHYACIKLSLLMYLWPIEGHAAASLQMREWSCMLISAHNMGRVLLFCTRLVLFHGPLDRFNLSEAILLLKSYSVLGFVLLMLGWPLIVACCEAL